MCGALQTRASSLGPTTVYQMQLKRRFTEGPSRNIVADTTQKQWLGLGRTLKHMKCFINDGHCQRWALPETSVVGMYQSQVSQVNV